MFILSSCSEELTTEVTEDISLDTEISINPEMGEELAIDELDGSILLEKTNSRSFRTLNQALRCTGLSSALFSGRKTIYAPTDQAFAKLGLNRHNICDELDKETLTEILLYHVVDGKVSTRERGCVGMLNGDVAQIRVKNHRLFINDSRIRYAFNQRGRHYYLRVYGINDVLIPPANNIVQTATDAPDLFASLVAAVLAANPGIASALSDPDAVYTVFAPTNEAFDNLVTALGASDLADLVGKVGADALSTILLYHVVDGCAFSNDLKDRQRFTTLQGEKIEIDLHTLSVIDQTNAPASLVPSGLDILTSNGIVHTIDKVLLPDAILANL